MNTSIDQGARPSESDAFSAAASNAYRQASHWGGEWSVMRAPDGAYHVFGLGSPSGKGMTEIGRAVSRVISDLSWVWTDGRRDQPPESPFADKVAPAKPARPAMSSLDKQSQALIEWLSHVMKIQSYFTGGQRRFIRCHTLGTWPIFRSEAQPLG